MAWLTAALKPRQTVPFVRQGMARTKRNFATTQFGHFRDIALAQLAFYAFTIELQCFFPSDQPRHSWVPNQAVGNSSTTRKHHFPHSHRHGKRFVPPQHSVCMATCHRGKQGGKKKKGTS